MDGTSRLYNVSCIMSAVALEELSDPDYVNKILTQGDNDTKLTVRLDVYMLGSMDFCSIFIIITLL